MDTKFAKEILVMMKICLDKKTFWINRWCYITIWITFFYIFLFFTTWKYSERKIKQVFLLCAFEFKFLSKMLKCSLKLCGLLVACKRANPFAKYIWSFGQSISTLFHSLKNVISFYIPFPCAPVYSVLFLSIFIPKLEVKLFLSPLEKFLPLDLFSFPIHWNHIWKTFSTFIVLNRINIA